MEETHAGEKAGAGSNPLSAQGQIYERESSIIHVMRRVYVETSVWSMVGPNQSPVLQGPTQEFLDQCAARVHGPFISAVVAEEVQRASPGIQELIIARLETVGPQVLAKRPGIEELAKRFIIEGVLPPRRLDDARHVAFALAHDLELLVSWNYRHIANVRKAEAFNAIAKLSGLRGALTICTPLEALEEI